ncbi:Elongator subunit elp4 [Actinomortierella ambigua]|nr:Elongator subunit elp4 [Actinomortierella ambigua]
MSSFKKRVPSAVVLPAGCRLSAYNGQVLISTGVPSLDDILGGGLPLGTILLIQEDRQTSYGQLLLKYFLRQGIVAGDKCAVVSGDESPEAIVRSLMGIVGEESDPGLTAGDDDDDDDDAKKKKSGPGDNDDKLTIAWRYSNLKKFESGVGERPPATSNSSKTGAPPTASQVPFCEQFDLTTRISAKALESADTLLIDSGELMRSEEEIQDSEVESDIDSDMTADRNKQEVDLYRKVLEKIRDNLVEGGFSTTMTKNLNDSPTATPAAGLSERHIFRIGINSIASPSWRSKTPHDLYKFLHALRGLLRFSFGAAVITIPAHLYGTPDQRHALDGSTTSPFIHKIEQLCDASVRIESFAGAQTNAASAASAYHGLFHVHKVPVLNALVPSSTKLSILLEGSAKGTGGAAGHNTRSGMGSLGFKVRRKRFAIETFHLPPEGGVGQRRTSAPSDPVVSTKKSSEKPSKESSSTSPSSSPSSTSTSTSSKSASGAPRRTISIGSEAPARLSHGHNHNHTHSHSHTSTTTTDAHDPVPGASGVARKMMGLPPRGLQGAVSSGCSTTSTTSTPTSTIATPRPAGPSAFARRPLGQGSSRPPGTPPGGSNPLDF